MKRIEATIQPYMLDKVKEALVNAGIQGMTVFDVRGFGRQKGHVELAHNTPRTLNFMPKLRIEIVVPDERLPAIVAAIQSSARTGKVGDGKIFISEMQDAIRIRTGDTGNDALNG